jgi:cell division protein FtsL
MARKRKRAKTTEFHTVKRIDNSRLVRTLEPSRLRELARWVGLGTLCLGFVLLYGWQRFHCIQLNYELEDLKSQQAQASTLNSKLRLEIAGLRNPMRIDLSARRQLRLTEPVPGQMEIVNGPSGAEVASNRLGRAPIPSGQTGGSQ